MTVRIEMLVEQIEVLPERARRDVGDLAGLMVSITNLGLLQPIGVNGLHQLVFGRRRLEAARRLGWTTIAVNVMANMDDAVRALHAELDENIERLPFTAVEAAALGRRIRALNAPEREQIIRERQQERRLNSGRFGGVADTAQPATVPEVYTAISVATGFSTRTLARVDQISELARDLDPEVAVAAAAAIAAIDAGSPVKPALDRVLDTQAVNRAIARYPELQNVKANPRHVQRMEEYLDVINDSGDVAALEVELQALASVWAPPAGDPPSVSSTTVARRELGFDINTTLAAAAERWDRAGGPGLLAELIPGFTPITVRSWRATADNLNRIAQEIHSALTEGQ